MKRALIVDDSEEIAGLVALIAAEQGFEPLQAVTPAEFMALMSSEEIDLVILDLGLPEADGIELMAWMASQSYTASVILISGMDENMLVAAKEIGLARGVNVIRTIPKPLFRENLIDAFQAFLDQG